jgi:Domain of unknown function (DUF4148)
MKRQVIATLVASLFAVPALADAGSQNAEQSYSWNYPALHATSSKSRAEVLAELVQAKQSGDVIADAETGAKAYQLYPSAYPAHAVAEGKSRGEVLAELRKAERDGDIVANAETGTLVKDL